MTENIEHIKKGDIVYVSFPFDNQKESKERPALVLFKSNDNSWVFCSITSKPHGEHKIQLNRRDLDSERIEYDPSYISPNIIATINQSSIRRKLGTLKANKLQEVIDKVKELLDKEAEDPPTKEALQRPKRLR